MRGINNLTKKIITVSLLLTACLAVSPASTAEDVRFPSPSGFVNDYARVLSPGARAGLEGLSREIERKTTAEVAVVTVKTTSPLTIEQYAVELFQKWGIGKKGADNGILVLVAVADRKVRIEVGYGLEGAVTDLESKMIIEDYMIPAFKKGAYDAGVSACVVSLAKLISAEYGVKLDLDPRMAGAPARGRRASAGGGLLTLLLFILIFGFRFGTIFFLMGSGRGYWSGGGRGSFGGGFGGFGGGLSGGGGASGSW